MLGTSSLMALPAEADFDYGNSRLRWSEYMATDSSDQPWERAKLFHLAWDASCSAFSGRQVLYERMFGGSPVRTLHCFVPELQQGTLQAESPPVPRR